MAEKQYTARMAFTLTLKPKVFSKKAKDQLSYALYDINESLRDHKYTLVYELTKACNIHFHGIISFNTAKMKGKNARMYWFDLWRKSDRIGFTDLKSETDEQGWEDYILKSVEETREMLPVFLEPVLRDDFNIKKI